MGAIFCLGFIKGEIRMKKKIILGAFTILIVFVVIAIALITNAKNKEEQLKTEMLNILLHQLLRF